MGFRAVTFGTRSVVAVLAFCVASGAGLAAAQTVTVRHVAPGATVELVLDTAPAGTTKAGSDGNATIVATNQLDAPIDVNVWVEVCGDLHRVILARRSVQLVPDFACRRTQIAGLYLLQRITSLVIDVRDTPSMLLRQGRAPDVWLRDPVLAVAEGPAEPLPPLNGLTLFGAVGRSSTLNFKLQSCGAEISCSDNAPMPYSGGVAWWFNDFIAAEARYGHLGDHTATGSGDTFNFTTTREGGVLAFTGRAGFRIGRLRPFGRAGMGLHRATVTTAQTQNDTTVTVNGVAQTVAGGTQIIQMRTRGWAPVYGGGAEVWISPRIGVFGDVQGIGLKGTDDRGSGIEIDDRVLTVQIGFAIRFPNRR
jgi:opacity protein-like surface antigen